MTAVWTKIALVVVKGWHLHPIEVKNTLLQGELEEEVWMVQPPDIESSKYSHTIFRLKKPFYKLKQNLRAWPSKIVLYIQTSHMSGNCSYIGSCMAYNIVERLQQIGQRTGINPLWQPQQHPACKELVFHTHTKHIIISVTNIGWRPWPPIHQHQWVGGRYFHKGVRSRQATTISMDLDLILLDMLSLGEV